jgi:hypothetical protein
MGCNCRSSKKQQGFIKEPDKLNHTQNGDEVLENIFKLLDQVIESFVCDIN